MARGPTPQVHHASLTAAHRTSLFGLLGRLDLQDLLDAERQQRQARQQHARRKGGLRVVFLVGALHIQRQRLRAPNDVAGDDGHGAELAHRPLRPRSRKHSLGMQGAERPSKLPPAGRV